MMRRVVGQRLVLSRERCWVVASKALLRAVAVVLWRLFVKCSKIYVDKVSDLMKKYTNTTVYILLCVFFTYLYYYNWGQRNGVNNPLVVFHQLLPSYNKKSQESKKDCQDDIRGEVELVDIVIISACSIFRDERMCRYPAGATCRERSHLYHFCSEGRPCNNTWRGRWGPGRWWPGAASSAPAGRLWSCLKCVKTSCQLWSSREDKEKGR